MQSKTNLNGRRLPGMLTQLAAVALGSLVLLSGCRQNDQGVDQNKIGASTNSILRADAAPSSTPTFSDFPVPPKPANTQALVAHGKDVYAQNCASCHGEK